jgi:hypothetical protein
MTFCNIFIVVAALAFCTVAKAQQPMAARLKQDPINARMATSRLSMPVVDEDLKTEVRVIRKQRSSGDANQVKSRVRAALREQKTKRVVAAQN